MGGEGAWWGMKVLGSGVKVLGGGESRCGCLEGAKTCVYILGLLLDQVSSG